MGKDGKPFYGNQSTFVKNMWGSPRQNLMTIFGGDLRSMALFRIFLALTVLLDLLNRSADLYAHYSDAGIMPRSLVLSNFQNDLWICLHLLSGLWTVQLVLFAIHALVAFFLLIGYYTKTMSFLTWILTLSLHNRNYLVLHGGDVLQRVILFFALFLPLGQCYSIDNAYFNPKNKLGGKNRLYGEQHYRTLSVATFAIMVQISLMYVTSYIHKTGAEWTTLRTSTWLALQLDYFRTPFGDFFLWFPEMLKILTASVLWWEGFGPVFYFLPVMSGPSRFFGVLGFWGMHLGFSLCLRLGQFGCMGMSANLAGLPTWFWEEVVFRRLRTKERTNFKLYYNPTSSFSTNIAIFISNFLLIGDTTVSPIPSDEEERRDNYEDVVDVKPSRTFSSMSSTWIMSEDYKGTSYSDYDAIISVCQVSPLLWPLAYLLRLPSVAKKLRGPVRYYGQQYSLSTKITQVTSNSSSALPPTQELIVQFWKLFKLIAANILCFLTLLYVLAWNAGNIGYHSYTVPNDLRWIAWFIHLDQSWSMFSPRPPSVQWYYIIDGQLDDGRPIELFRNGGLFSWEPNDVSWEKPSNYKESFKNHRWFKYYENGINSHPNNDQLRLHWGRYICREYNNRHHGVDRLYKFSINWMSERADPDTPRVLLPKQTIWNHMCYEK